MHNDDADQKTVSVGTLGTTGSITSYKLSRKYLFCTLTFDPKSVTIKKFPIWDFICMSKYEDIIFMRVVGLGVLASFCDKHADCRKWVSNWIKDAQTSRWENSHDIKYRYPSASFLAANVVIFNVRGNEYRMETQVAYNAGVIVIKWIGTHDQYTKRMH